MALPFGALAGRIAASDVALQQRSAQDLGDRWKLLSQPQPTWAEGQFGKSAQAFACLHISASLHQNRPFGASANLMGCEFPPTLFIQKGGKYVCEVPGSCRVTRKSTTRVPGWFCLPMEAGCISRATMGASGRF